MSTKRFLRRLLPLLAAAALLLQAAPTVLAAAPSNDDFNAAVPFSALPYDATADTTDATSDPDDPFPSCTPPTSHTVWYAFTPSSTVDVTANTFGSDYDTTLSVWTGTRTALSEVACNDDSGSLQSRVGFTAVSGTTYFLMVGSFCSLIFCGFESPGGSLVLHVGPLPPPLQLSLSINRQGQVSASGVATIHGTITCSREALGVRIIGTIRQQVNNKAAVASYATTVDCHGTTAWSASAAGETKPFRRGSAQVVAATNFIDPERGENSRARATRTVNLQ
jgi:hypothetical protein